MSRNDSHTPFRDRPNIGYWRHRFFPMRVYVLLIVGLGLILLAYAAYDIASKAREIDIRAERASLLTCLSGSTPCSVLCPYPVMCRRLSDATTTQSL